MGANRRVVRQTILRKAMEVKRMTEQERKELAAAQEQERKDQYYLITAQS